MNRPFWLAALAMYRDDVIIPLGLASMLLQALLYAWAYPRLFGDRDWCSGAMRFGLVFGVLAWSLTVLPVAAKYRMSSVGGFLVLETAFTALQYVIVSPLIAWASTRGPTAERGAVGTV